MGAENDGLRITVPVLAGLLVGAASLGGSSVGFLQSWQNSATAVSVAVQHGREIQHLRDDIADLNTQLVRRTAERWTRTEHLRYAAERDREIETIRRRLELLERVENN